jgi:hypothetical protein
MRMGQIHSGKSGRWGVRSRERKEDTARLFEARRHKARFHQCTLYI